MLRQTVSNFEVLIIGDGATIETEREARRLEESDPRIRYLHFPKGRHHGETYRHVAIEKARSDSIFYLCDDDILMPNHLENLLELLDDNDFAQSRNGYFDLGGELKLYPTDLSRKDVVSWHLKRPRRNFVSLTGTAHKKDVYFSIKPWETTPKGEWPDHYMWKKFFRLPDLRAATHLEMTALQFPTSVGRQGHNQELRYAELRKWDQFASNPNSREILKSLVDQSANRLLVDLSMSSFYSARRILTRASEIKAKVVQSFVNRLVPHTLNPKKPRKLSRFDQDI